MSPFIWAYDVSRSSPLLFTVVKLGPKILDLYYKWIITSAFLCIIRSPIMDS